MIVRSLFADRADALLQRVESEADKFGDVSYCELREGADRAMIRRAHVKGPRLVMADNASERGRETDRATGESAVCAEIGRFGPEKGVRSM